jgi:hypothetical protein
MSSSRYDRDAGGAGLGWPICLVAAVAFLFLVPVVLVGGVGAFLCRSAGASRRRAALPAALSVLPALAAVELWSAEPTGDDLVRLAPRIGGSP